MWYIYTRQATWWSLADGDDRYRRSPININSWLGRLWLRLGLLWNLPHRSSPRSNGNAHDRIECLCATYRVRLYGSNYKHSNCRFKAVTRYSRKAWFLFQSSYPPSLIHRTIFVRVHPNSMKHLITELSHIYLFVGHGQSIWKLDIKLTWQERRFRFNAVE